MDTKVLYDAGDTVAGLLRLHPGAREVSHVHLHGERHLWVLAGRVLVDETEFAADSYVHVPPMLRHTVQDGGEGSLLFYVFCPIPD